MKCGRSAILMLIASAVLGAPSHGSDVTGDPADRVHSLTTGHSVAMTAWLRSPWQSHGPSLSQFTRWKTRIKSVLEETEQRVVEECDFGPATLCGQFFTSTAVHLLSCPLCTRPPLRC